MDNCKWFGHKWKYENPHSRWCKRCNKSQMQYSEAGMTIGGYIKMFDVWEDQLTKP